MSRFFFNLLSITIISLLTMTASAANFIVKGIATDTEGEPESFATVKVFSLNDTVKPVSMGVTDVKGMFNRNIKTAGRYRLVIVSVGKTPAERKFEVSATHPTADLDTIVMKIADNILGEVTVEAAKPLVTLEVDRIGYDVQGDAESKTTMLNEMLNKVPLVSVDEDGTIKVNGGTDFKIYKNGRPNNSYSRNAKDIFKSLPASMIQKIEVITEPGAREDAEGVSAILNIITVKNAVTKGVTGNVSLNYNTRQDIPSPGLWLSAQYDKFTMSLYGGMNFTSRRQTKGDSESVTEYEQTGNVMENESESSSKGLFGYWGFDSSLDIDKYNLLTLEFGGFAMRHQNNSLGITRMYDAAGNTLYSYGSRSDTDPSKWHDLNGNFSYQRSTDREGEAIIFSYRLSSNQSDNSSETEYYDRENLPFQYTGINSTSEERGIEHTLQLDWTRPINKQNSIDVGGKYIYRDNHSNSDREYIDLRTDKSEFKHITQVGALFADYRLNLGKFGARAGLRYEYSHLSAKYPDGSNNPFSADLNDWVPNAGLIFNPNRKNSLKLSFGSRIQRPGITYLNPAVNTSPNSTSQGNPNLESVRRNSFTLSYNYMSAKVNVSLSSTFGFTNNGIINVQNTIEDHTYSTYANQGRERTFSTSGYVNWRPNNKTSLMLNGSVNYNHVENRSLGDKSSGWGNMIFARISQKLPYKITISANASSFLWAPSLYSSFRSTGWSNLNWSIGVQRDFLKEDRLSTRINISNPIHDNDPAFISKSWTDGMRSRTISHRYGMTSVNFSVSYRFGSLSTSVKKVKKGITNDDVVGGSNNGGGNSGEGGSGN